MTAPLRERLEAAIAHIHTYQGNPIQIAKHIATLTEAIAALAEREKDAKWRELANQAITSIGSFDRGLQEHYCAQARSIDAAIKEGKNNG